MSSEASEDSAASVASEISDVSRLGNGVQEAESPEAHVPAARASQTSAPLLQDRYFDTWDDFFDCLAAFQDGTHQVFKKRASTTTAARNKDLVKRGNASKTTTTPPSFDRYYRRFVCTHGWSRPSRSDQEDDGHAVYTTTNRQERNAAGRSQPRGETVGRTAGDDNG